MDTIPEQHNSYLAQNLMANAALRSSIGNFMDFKAESAMPMQSSPCESPVRQIPAPANVHPLDQAPSDPFKASLINQLLERVAFPGPHVFGYINLQYNPRISIKKEPINIGNI